MMPLGACVAPGATNRATLVKTTCQSRPSVVRSAAHSPESTVARRALLLGACGVLGIGAAPAWSKQAPVLLTGASPSKKLVAMETSDTKNTVTHTLPPIVYVGGGRGGKGGTR